MIRPKLAGRFDPTRKYGQLHNPVRTFHSERGPREWPYFLFLVVLESISKCCGAKLSQSLRFRRLVCIRSYPIGRSRWRKR
jgi:hypothetical protein